jgi:hypothetical protein
MRHSLIKTGKVNNTNLTELKAILIKDQQNQGEGNLLGPAIELLDKDLESFLKKYFNIPAPTGVKAHMYFNDSLPPDVKTVWTITSK